MEEEEKKTFCRDGSSSSIRPLKRQEMEILGKREPGESLSLLLFCWYFPNSKLCLWLGEDGCTY